MLLWSFLVIFGPASAQTVSLIIKEPPPIFEGDRIALTCQKEKIQRIKTITYYKDEKELSSFKKVSVLSIQNVNVSDSGNYSCTIVAGIWRRKKTSQKISVKVQELFQRPVLMASSFQPIEGGPVTLTCETRLHPWRSQVQLQFRFFRDSRVLGSGWNSSQQLQVPAMWREDSGSYWCEAETLTHSIRKQSPASQIYVQRIPVSNVSLETWVPRGQAVEGGTLDLLCSVADATGNITFSWHREATGVRVGKKTQHGLTGELRVPVVQDSDSGGYYCTADNGYGPVQSKVVNVPVREHFGNYSSEADNGLKPQRSEVVTLPISGANGYRRDLVTAKVLGGLFGILGFTGVALLFYCWSHKTAGESTATNAPSLSALCSHSLPWGLSHRSASSPNPPESTHSGPLPAVEDLQPEYVNVGMDVIYSKVWSIQQSERPANTGRLFLENESPEVIYSSVKKCGDYPDQPACALKLGYDSSFTPALEENDKTETDCEREYSSLGCAVDLGISEPSICGGINNFKADNFGEGRIRKEQPSDDLGTQPFKAIFCFVSSEQRPPVLFLGQEISLALGEMDLSCPRPGQVFMFLWLLLLSLEKDNKTWGARRAGSPGQQKGPQDSHQCQTGVPESAVTLKIQPSGGQLIEGEKLVLTCSVAKDTASVTFSWHREGRGNLGIKTWHSPSAELQVPAVAGRYYCTADNSCGPLVSNKITVTVRIPASQPVLTLRAPRTPTVVEDEVELHCEALRGSPPILYQFYHEDIILGNSSAPSGGGVSFFLTLTTNHSGNYFCEADNGLGPQRSQRVSLSVTVPVSRPILSLRTLRVPRAQAMVGDVVELRCEALTGSPPILYRFYHEDVALWNCSVPSGGGVAFNLSLTAEYSGNYSCEADNGLGAQRSEMVTLRVTGTPRSRTGLVTGGAVSGLLSVLGLAATTALLCHFRTQRKSRGFPATGTSSYSPHKCWVPSLSRPSRRDPQKPPHQEPLTLLQLQPVNPSVIPEDSIVYSQIWSFKLAAENSANPPTMHREDKELEIFYSNLKEVPYNDSTGLACSRGRTSEADTGNYENVLCARPALDH
ncbi:uncharacterized protein LOC128596489 [Nycticebus coucang]|uniref:uncharacterized protein LOC128596489 n=1 Tax=Nycticebus coucang TaxID=9470 RepID=UPI00234DB61A|nr:uncharacterized protein LOC128596489 [Nycticebus coucang]